VTTDSSHPADVPQITNLAQGILSPRAACRGLFLVLALTAVVRYSVLDMPLDRDEGEYAYGAQRLLVGKLPYVEFYSMKLPGMYFVYALIETVGGHSLRAIHAALLLVNAATIGLLFFIGLRWFNPLAALAAASIFAALSLTHKVEGTSTQAEPFILLPIVAALALATPRVRDLSPLRWLVIGLLCGLAILIKQQAAFFAIGAFVAWAWNAVRLERFLRSQALLGGILLAAGTLLPYAALCTFYWQQGAWDDFQRWTIDYARQYGTLRPLGDGLSDLLRQLTHLTRQGLAVVWALAAIGLVASLRDHSEQARRAGLWGFALVSFLAVSTGLYFRPHYFVLLLPAVALASAAGLLTALRWLRASQAHHWLSIALVAIAVVWPLASQSLLILSLGPEQLTRRTFGRSPFPESLEIADYLRAHTDPGQPIGMLGSEPQILFYAARESATGYLYMYPLMENQPAARTMQAEFIAQFEAAQPEYVVYAGVPTSWLARETSVVDIFTWWDRYQSAHYERVGLVEIEPTGVTQYFWDEAQVGHEPKEGNWLAIYRRVKADGPPAKSQ